MADWIGISSAHYDSHCGDTDNHTIEEALDGTDYWRHNVDEDHYVKLNLGAVYNVTKVRGRSNLLADPTDVEIYVSMNGVDWGAAVAVGIATWEDTNDFVEVDTTDKEGQYVLVKIVDTADVDRDLAFGAAALFTIFDVYCEQVQRVSPDVLTLQATLQSPIVVTSLTITPNALALQATLQAPTIKFPIQKALPNALTSTVTVNSPSIVIDCTVTPAALVLQATLQAATATPSLTITPNALVLQATIQAPTIIVDCTVTPDALVLQATLQAPTIIVDCTVTPDELTLELILQTSTICIVFDEIPPFMHKDLIDHYSGGAWLWLCQIVVPTQTTQRIARNTEDVNYGGDVFDKFNFDVSEQVFSSDGSIPQVTLRIFQDVNRRIENIINATNGALGADIKLIRVNEKFLDTPVTALEMDYENLASESDSEWVTFTLGLPNPLTQRYPLEIYNSSMCPEATPTLFKGPACQYAGDDTSCTGTYEDCYAKGNAEFWGGELGLSANVVRV